MTKLYEMEQPIMDCWGIVDDLKLVFHTLGEREVTDDELQNVLLGLFSLYDMKFEKLFKLYEQAIREQHKHKIITEGLAKGSHTL